jgi:uncharacterized damage-inducible protein DinB
MITAVEATLRELDFTREKTLGTLDAIERLPGNGPREALGWRPGPGRAHLAWQLVHLAITEELFASERLLGTNPGFAELVPRFKGGSTPDDQIPALQEIRRLFDESRAHLRQTLMGLTEADLPRIPPALKERGISIARVLLILPWHEAHHQGQAHLTLNLYKAAHP